MALSQQDFEKLKARLSSTGSQPSVSDESSGIVTNVKNDFNARVNAGASAINSNQNPISKTLQTIGQGAGFVGDLGLDALKAVTPQPIENAVSSAVTKVAQTKPAQSIMSALSTWASAHPEASKNLQAIIDIASIVPAGKVAGVAENTALKAGDEALKLGSKSVSATKNLIQDSISPIDKGVESVLNPAKLIPKENLKNIPLESIKVTSENKSAKLESYLKQAQKAVSDYSQPTPLEIAGTKAEDALNVINNKLAKQGQLKKEALGVVGEKKVSNISTLRNELRDNLRERVGVNVITDANGLSIEPATGRASKIAFDKADNQLIIDTYKTLSNLGNKPTVKMLDDTVDALQDLLYKRKSAVAIPVNGQVEGVIKNITGRLNSAVKKVAGEQYTKANSKFAYFVDSRDKLNKALGIDATKGGSLMKRIFSPTDGGTKELFNQVKKLTGIDLVEEATLAKFVMENVGDARQASLLEEVLKGNVSSPSSFVGKATSKILNKIQDPIAKAKRIINTRVK